MPRQWNRRRRKEGQNAQLTPSATIYSPYCIIFGHLSGAEGEVGREAWVVKPVQQKVDFLRNLGSAQILYFVVYILTGRFGNKVHSLVRWDACSDAYILDSRVDSRT